MLDAKETELNKGTLFTVDSYQKQDEQLIFYESDTFFK
tara:strand:+ start:354 stop:467 length:114 start_codon:yes stop_codon:yes gene_type:complete